MQPEWLNCEYSSKGLTLPLKIDTSMELIRQRSSNSLIIFVIEAEKLNIQLFLRSYPTPNVIRETVAALQNIPQLTTEYEYDYTRRLSTALS